LIAFITFADNIRQAEERMRIEMVLPALRQGGMETMVAALTRGLVLRGTRSA